MSKTPLNPATVSVEILAEIAKKASRKADRQARKAGIAVAGIDGSPRSVSPDQIVRSVRGKKRIEA